MPAKICIVCNRLFNWPKKWAIAWNKIKYCSSKYRRKVITQHNRNKKCKYK
ncbi:MAG: DUF2256 domain-containing protein [Chitinophagaceae bacterium]